MQFTSRPITTMMIFMTLCILLTVTHITEAGYRKPPFNGSIFGKRSGNSIGSLHNSYHIHFCCIRLSIKCFALIINLAVQFSPNIFKQIMMQVAKRYQHYVSLRLKPVNLGCPKTKSKIVFVSRRTQKATHICTHATLDPRASLLLIILIG